MAGHRPSGAGGVVVCPGTGEASTAVVDGSELFSRILRARILALRSLARSRATQGSESRSLVMGIAPHPVLFVYAAVLAKGRWQECLQR